MTAARFEAQLKADLVNKLPVATSLYCRSNLRWVSIPHAHAPDMTANNPADEPLCFA